MDEPEVERSEEIEESELSTGSPEDGTGGDAGSGPTGDVRNSPGVVGESDGIANGNGNTPIVVAAAGGLLTGIILGWVLWA
ncbi:MAG: hypothetical protein KDB57_05050 [Solirubrobacterales bacterium]|nr:hypothetical protein [Solirubrobacterales bacterium]